MKRTFFDWYRSNVSGSRTSRRAKGRQQATRSRRSTFEALEPRMLLATYYVDGPGGSGGTGNDGTNVPGTMSQPWATLNRAFDTTKNFYVHAGDTLYIRGGTYAERLYRNIPAGLSNTQHTQIFNYPSETVIIKPNTGTDSHVIAIRWNDYITIKADAKYRIQIDGGNILGSCVNLETSTDGASHCDYITLENLEIKNAEGNGILGKGTNYLFKDLSIHHNGSDPTHNCGIYTGCSNSTITGCDVYENARVGINIWDQNAAPGECSNNKIFNNRVHHNGTEDYYAEGIAIRRGDNNEVYNNLVWDNVTGISDGFGAKGTKIYSNTVYNNTRSASEYNAGIWLFTSSSNAVVRNNLCYANPDSNYRNQGIGTTASNNATGTTNPNFASTNPASADFLKLSASTPTSIKDAGYTLGSPYNVDYWGTSRPQGSAYDIGAHELVTVPAAPTNLGATTASSSQINLSWTDTSSNETAFKIDRATNQPRP